eukprot:g6545.t1
MKEDSNTEAKKETFEDLKESTQNFELVDIVWDFCRSGDFTEIFESFVKENISELRHIKPLDEEQNVVFTELFQKMLVIFENKISEYVSGKGYTVDEFYNQCRIIRESKDIIGEDHEDQLWFVDMLLKCTTYEQFHEIISNAIAGRETKMMTK